MNEQERSLPPKITKADITKEKESKKGKFFYWTKVVLYLLVSSFLVSFSAHALIAPNEFTIGGISGIAILLNVATAGKIQQSIVLFSKALLTAASRLICPDYFVYEVSFAEYLIHDDFLENIAEDGN